MIICEQELWRVETTHENPAESIVYVIACCAQRAAASAQETYPEDDIVQVSIGEGPLLVRRQEDLVLEDVCASCHAKRGTRSLRSV